MKADLPTEADTSRRLTLGDVRERVIQVITEHWKQSLIDLARQLKCQGFSKAEVLELAENMRPMFDQNVKEVLLKLDLELGAAHA